MPLRAYSFAAALCLAALAPAAWGQAECHGWGEFRGIRVDGELVPFSTSIKLLDPDARLLAFSATQTVNNPRFSRNGDSQTSTGSIHNNALAYTHTVQDTAPGAAKVSVQTTASRDQPLRGAYYYVTLPVADYAGGTFEFLDAAGARLSHPFVNPAAGPTRASAKARSVRLIGPTRQLELSFESPIDVTVQNDKFIDTDYVTQDGLRLPVDPQSLERFSLSFPLVAGNLTAGQTAATTFTIKATATLDRKPVSLALDWQKPGPSFQGIGGNFRIQSPQDQAHIAYNLQNLRVAWGRVEMPLANWWPQENVDPVAAAATAPAAASPASAPATGRRGRGGRGAPGGPANTGIQQAMAMAKTLADKNIPFMAATWGVPQWALGPSPRKPDQPQGIQALRMNPDKMEPVCKAIVSYLSYMKKHYNAEAAMVSFNESDLGINVLHTPQEHALFIKTLGPMLQAAGLKTKLVLADAASPHPVRFMDAAMADPECIKHIGGVSFHSWHDGTPEEFALWGQAARKLNVPLFCGEGGIDADAHRYPQLFLEPWFALYEIDTYLQILQHGQAASVLHWQLTENYSVLTSGRGNAPPQPTRRFFNLKQLNLTPPDAPFIPMTGSAPNITHAAYGNAATATLSIHLLNNAAARDLTLTGLPPNIPHLRAFITDHSRHLHELEKLSPTAGSLKLTLPPNALLTLTTTP